MKEPITRRRFVTITATSLAGAVVACGDDPPGDGGVVVAPGPYPDVQGADAAGDASPMDVDGSDTAMEVDIGPELVDTADGDGDGDGSDGGDVVEGFDPAALPQDEDLFPLGVQAGDATSDGVILWTWMDSEDPLRVVVWTRDEEGAAVVVAEGEAPLAEGGYCHVELTALEAATAYEYCFVRLGGAGEPVGRTAVGRFRTAPDLDALEVVSFGGVSCNFLLFHPFPVLSRAGEDELDFFVLGGDTVYADGNVDVGEYRAVWKEYLAADGYRTLLQSTSTLCTWDDHEVTNNWDPETINPDQLAAATQAYFENLPIRLHPDDSSRVWRSARWGKTLEVFVLDCRSERKPSTRDTPEAQYISPEQMAWLKDGLANSPCLFKLIVNSVPISDMPSVSVSDRWEGYPAQRTEILDFVNNEVEGVVWLTGDFHLGAMSEVGAEGSPHSAQREVFMGPGGQLPNPLWVVLEVGSQKDQFSFVTDKNNYVRFTADPHTDPPTLTVEFVDQDGDILHGEAISLEG